MKIENIKVTKNGNHAQDNLLDYEKIGENIHNARIKRGYKNGESFYKALYPGLKKTGNAASKFISAIESGKSLNLEKLVLISKCLNMSIDSLIYGESNNSRDYTVYDACSLLAELSNVFDLSVVHSTDLPQAQDAKEIDLRISPKIVSRLVTNDWQPTFNTDKEPQKIIHFTDGRAISIENFLLDFLMLQSLSNDEVKNISIKSLLEKCRKTPLKPCLEEKCITDNMLRTGDNDIYQYDGDYYFEMSEEDIALQKGKSEK